MKDKKLRHILNKTRHDVYQFKKKKKTKTVTGNKINAAAVTKMQQVGVVINNSEKIMEHINMKQRTKVESPTEIKRKKPQKRKLSNSRGFDPLEYDILIEELKREERELLL